MNRLEINRTKVSQMFIIAYMNLRSYQPRTCSFPQYFEQMARLLVSAIEYTWC